MKTLFPTFLLKVSGIYYQTSTFLTHFCHQSNEIGSAIIPTQTRDANLEKHPSKLMSKPKFQAKAKSKPQSKSKSQPKKRKNAAESSSNIKTEPTEPDDDSDIEIIDSIPPCKKAKHNDTEEESEKEGDEEEQEESTKIQIYLNVETPPPPQIRVGNRAVRQPAIKVTPRGPFIFDSNNNYIQFLSVIATGARAGHPDCLIRSG